MFDCCSLVEFVCFWFVSVLGLAHLLWCCCLFSGLWFGYFVVIIGLVFWRDDFCCFCGWLLLLWYGVVVIVHCS